MADPYIQEFNARLRRIAKIRRRGGAFEAYGTLGQSYYTRLNRRRGLPVMRYVVIILGALILFKAVAFASLGPADYLARVSTLQSGNWAEQMGATLMAADPVTRSVGQTLTPLFR